MRFGKILYRRKHKLEDVPIEIFDYAAKMVFDENVTIIENVDTYTKIFYLAH